MSFVSSKGNILCRLIKIELYKIFAIINPVIKGLHCMSVNWVSIGSDNGLSPIRRKAIILTNAGLLSIGPFGTNFR